MFLSAFLDWYRWRVATYPQIFKEIREKTAVFNICANNTVICGPLECDGNI